MNRFSKGLTALILSCTTITAGLLAPLHAQAAVPLDVKVQVNDKLVQFPDAQPFMDQNERTLVPIRFVTEMLGYQVGWEKVGNDVKVQLTSNKHTVTLISGQKNAWIDGKEITMDTNAEFKQGRVFVPLRFISEAADIHVKWDQANYLAILNQDGKDHAPDFTVFQATAYSADTSENGGFGAIDYMGNPLQVGTVAVDPSVIPLGSKLYIEGYDFAGLPTGGMVAYATDIGGAIKGNHLDIFIPGSRASLSNFGIQQVKVYRLS
jgi:3D (Asp-Asp-Asp) domain-containing protein